MKTTAPGLEIIRHFEGLRLSAYPCSAHVWTIGYGHTAGVSPGDSISAEAAERLLRQDITEAEKTVSRYVSVPLSQNQFDALVSFVFNLGAGNFRTSTLLKKLNAGDTAGASEEFLRWINAAGRPLPGLIRRREAEKALFNNPA